MRDEYELRLQSANVALVELLSKQRTSSAAAPLQPQPLAKPSQLPTPTPTPTLTPTPTPTPIPTLADMYQPPALQRSESQSQALVNAENGNGSLPQSARNSFASVRSVPPSATTATPPEKEKANAELRAENERLEALVEHLRLQIASSRALPAVRDADSLSLPSLLCRLHKSIRIILIKPLCPIVIM